MPSFDRFNRDRIIAPMKRLLHIASVFVCLAAVGQMQGLQATQDNAAKSSGTKAKVTPPKFIEGPDPAPTFDEGKGPTVFTVTIGTDGLVHDPKLIKSSDSKRADANALEAIQKWKYKPATKDGVPVVVSINIEVHARPL
jgi:TonB family protein